jgi:hypothetical protein
MPANRSCAWRQAVSAPVESPASRCTAPISAWSRYPSRASPLGEPVVWQRLPWDAPPKTGVLPAFRVETGLATKFPWWRLRPGALSVTAELRPASGNFPPSGYGSTGFVPSELTFSAEGCWEVTASVQNDQPLVFVIWVQETSRG